MVSWHATRGTSSAGLEAGAGAGAERPTRQAWRTSWMLPVLFAASLAGACATGVAGCGVSKPAGGTGTGGAGAKGGAGGGAGAAGAGGAAGAAGAGGPAQKLTILHTGDMHSHL